MVLWLVRGRRGAGPVAFYAISFGDHSSLLACGSERLTTQIAARRYDMMTSIGLHSQQFQHRMMRSRHGVPTAAGALQPVGLIGYCFGIAIILDGRGQWQHACGCYGVSKWEYDRVLLGRPRRWFGRRKLHADRI